MWDVSLGGYVKDAAKISLAIIFPLGDVTATKNGYEKKGLSDLLALPFVPNFPSKMSFRSTTALFDASLHVLSALRKSTRDTRLALFCFCGFVKSLIELKSSTISTCGHGLSSKRSLGSCDILE